MPNANPKLPGITAPDILSPELRQSAVAEGSFRVENPSDPFEFYGWPRLARLRVEAIAGPRNVRARRARFLLAALQRMTKARADLLYPDPWPKRRHWKRRFVSDANVAALARIMTRGGEFRFATDWANYAEWTLQRLLRSRDFTWTAERADDWRRPWPEFGGTRYEEKAMREGRAPIYLTFRRS